MITLAIPYVKTEALSYVSLKIKQQYYANIYHKVNFDVIYMTILHCFENIPEGFSDFGIVHHQMY